MNSETEILLVEDEDMLRGLIEEILKLRGYSVHCAASGDEAAALAETPGFRLDVVITDVMMPRMTGNQLVDRLRPRFENMKVIFISGFTGASSPSIQRALEMPGVSFLQKPFRLQVLVEEVETLLGRAG